MHAISILNSIILFFNNSLHPFSHALLIHAEIEFLSVTLVNIERDTGGLFKFCDITLTQYLMVFGKDCSQNIALVALSEFKRQTVRCFDKSNINGYPSDRMVISSTTS